MILITGSNGQLGHDIQKIYDKNHIAYIPAGHKELDITDIDSVKAFVKGKNIDLIFNCAAYNDVDKAEKDRDECYKLNVLAPKNLAEIAKNIDSEFITFSSDFVFNGKKRIPYTEDDIPDPLSFYAKCKLQGEREVINSYNKIYIVRSSWLFGLANNNFVKQVIDWSKKKTELSIVDDQISSPTYSYDLAYYSAELLKTKKYGLYHLSNNGIASKYDQAKYILDKIGWKGTLNKATTASFNLPAKRSGYTKLDPTKLEKTIGQKLPTWQNGIDRFLKELGY